MISIRFHSKTRQVEVHGQERAAMGCLLRDSMWNFLSCYVDDFEEVPSILRKIIPGNHYTLSAQNKAHFKQRLETSVKVGMDFFIDGSCIDTFTLALNTGLRLGNDPVKLFARLNGQCEIHCWVEGLNRRWLADIIADGLDIGLYRQNMGWEDVIVLLREDRKSPIVTSYSVTRPFPNNTVAGYASIDAWDRLLPATQWSRAIDTLRVHNPLLELNPISWDNYSFNHGWDMFKVTKYLDALLESA